MPPVPAIEPALTLLSPLRPTVPAKVTLPSVMMAALPAVEWPSNFKYSPLMIVAVPAVL